MESGDSCETEDFPAEDREGVYEGMAAMQLSEEKKG